jgi:N-acetylglutamate synthase-like GNAT family acetyltransferase
MAYVTTDKSCFDIDTIHRFLSRDAYWSLGIPRERLEQAIANSLCFAVFGNDGRQAGFARVITDYVSVAYLADVFVLPSHRGRGLSKLLMQAVREHPDLQQIRRWLLVTRDAHGLYQQYGFRALSRPERLMEIVNMPPERGGNPPRPGSSIS